MTKEMEVFAERYPVPGELMDDKVVRQKNGWALFTTWVFLMYLLDRMKSQAAWHQDGKSVRITDKDLKNCLRIWNISDCALLIFLWNHYF